jgi:hypothetical protein
MSKATRSLDAPTLELLAKGSPVLLLSADAKGRPHATYSWAIALNDKRLRIAVDRGGHTSANWQRSGLAAIQIVGQGGRNLLIDGRARQLAPALQCEAAMEPWELAIQSVLDQSWPGVATSSLRYRWPRERAAAMRRFEKGLYRELLGIGGARR